MTVNYINKIIDDLKRSEKTEQSEFLIFVLKREIPKAVCVRRNPTKKQALYTCPSCGILVGNHKRIVRNECYCKHCGQKITYEGV